MSFGDWFAHLVGLVLGRGNRNDQSEHEGPGFSIDWHPSTDGTGEYWVVMGDRYMPYSEYSREYIEAVERQAARMSAEKIERERDAIIARERLHR